MENMKKSSNTEMHESIERNHKSMRESVKSNRSIINHKDTPSDKSSTWPKNKIGIFGKLSMSSPFNKNKTPTGAQTSGATTAMDINRLQESEQNADDT